MSRELLKQALYALKYHSIQTRPIDLTNETIEALRQELAKPEQEHGFDRTASHMAGEYVDTSPPKAEKQEPVAYVSSYHYGRCVITLFNPALIMPPGVALYTAPLRKEWVGLTDEEEIELDEKYGDDFNAYIDARDAKLKELNAVPTAQTGKEK